MPTLTKSRTGTGEAARCQGDANRLFDRLSRTLEELRWCEQSGLSATDERFSTVRTVTQLRGDAVELAAALVVALDCERSS